MKLFSAFVIVSLTFASSGVQGQDLDQAGKMEASGDVAGARAALSHAVDTNPGNVTALTNYAEFLQRYGDAACREVYTRLIAALRQSGDTARAALIAKRLALFDLLAGDVHHPVPPPGEASPTIPIPGPLRSFARMTAIAGDANPDDVLPALARNVVTNGYQASHNNEALEQTEYLKLVHRYLSQAHELEKLAGESKILRIENCESPSVGELLRILGFRIRGGCGSEVVLETVNAARAFLTTDSGFPINQLEEALRTNRPFTYDYHPTAAGVLFGQEYWASGSKDKDIGDFADYFISDPSLCRLYLGLSKLDRETAEELRKAIPFARLKAYSHVLDFFGGMFEIRGGKAVLPGVAHSGAVWADLVGASPDRGTDFFDKLMAKDDGWLASLYDSVARINGPVQEYLLQPERMKRFYSAVRGRITSPGPARPVFRANTDMMLLTTRLHLDADGKPHVPGNLDVWKNLFTNHPQGKYDGKLTRLATTWKEPDDFHGHQRLGSQPRAAPAARHRGPPGAGLPRIRRTVPHLQRVAHHRRQDRHAVPRHGGSPQQDSRAGFPFRRHRLVPIAGEPVADPRPPTVPCGEPGRRRTFRHRRLVWRYSQQPRAVRCRPRRFQTAAGGRVRRTQGPGAGSPGEPAERWGLRRFGR
jgi:hypothetical protein